MYGNPMALPVPEERIADFCERHRIIRMSVFGSAIRDDFGPESDVDVLVEFEPGHAAGLDFFGMEEELSGIFGRPVDLNTPGWLSPYFRSVVLAEARPLYVQAR